MARQKRERERGIAVILTALMMVFTLPIVGLAVDAGVMYVIKSRLSAACDAASLAAARSLNVGQTFAAQIANAENRARAFFNGNFPDGLMATSEKSISITSDSVGVSGATLQITVTGSVRAPTYFMRILGRDYVPISASGKASRTDVNLVLVLDRSGSMGPACADMVRAARNFASMFVEGRDRLSLVTFGGAAFVAYAPSKNFKSSSPSLDTQISNVTCGSSTNTAWSYFQAYNQLMRINEPSALNLIVFFTDGIPNGVTANFPVRRNPDRRFGYDNYPRIDGLQCQPGTGTSQSNPCVQLASTCRSRTAECLMPPSSCKDSSNRVYDYRNPGNGWGTGVNSLPDRFGSLSYSTDVMPQHTNGIKNPVATTFSTSDPEIAAKAGCAFDSNSLNMRRDVGSIPNSVTYTGTGGSVTLDSTGYKPVIRFGQNEPTWYNAMRSWTKAQWNPYTDLTGNPQSSWVPAFNGGTYTGDYSNQIRPDIYWNILHVGLNHTDNLATVIRNDTTLNVVTYSIGFTAGVDPELLRRMSNDTNSPTYNPDRPTGLYVYAPNTTELQQAFVRVASEILRLAR